jgi:hypothetical protein
MPILRHTTPARNLTSIRCKGLLTAFSKGRLPACWFHSRSLSSWAMLHVSQRHNVPVSRLVTIEVSIPRTWLKRVRTHGLYYILVDAPPERLRKALTFEEIAASPEPFG